MKNQSLFFALGFVGLLSCRGDTVPTALPASPVSVVASGVIPDPGLQSRAFEMAPTVNKSVPVEISVPKTGIEHSLVLLAPGDENLPGFDIQSGFVIYKKSFESPIVRVPYGQHYFILEGGYSVGYYPEGAKSNFSVSSAKGGPIVVSGRKFDLKPSGSVLAVRDEKDGSWVFNLTDAQAKATPILETTVDHGVIPTPLQEPGPVQFSDFDTELTRLYSLPKKSITLRDTSLDKAFQVMALACNINFVLPSDLTTASVPSGVPVSGPASIPSGPSSSKMVSLITTVNPFRLLELVASEYGYRLDHELYQDPVSGSKSWVWIARSYEREGLIGRTYHIRFNNGESVDFTNSSSSSAPTSGGTGGSGGGVSSLSDAASTLAVSGSTIILTNVNSLLQLTDPGLVIAGEYEPATALVQTERDFNGNVRPAMLRSSRAVVSSPQSRAIWNQDADTLFVVATRQQHEWVRGYLKSIDRKPKVVVLDIQFVEASQDILDKIGAKFGDGTNTFNVGVTPNTAYPVTSQGVVGGGLALSASSFPLNGILSAADLAVTIQMLKSDGKSTNITGLQASVVERRQVSIKFGTREPVLGGSSSTGSAGGVGTSQNTSSVQYIDIGTDSHFRAAIIDGDAVRLSLALTLNSITGSRLVSGNSYPVTANRDYSGESVVRSGYTLAIGGFDQSTDYDTVTKLPILGDIPGLGNFFKNKEKSRSKSKLLIFVTPRILNDYDSGLESVVRHGSGRALLNGRTLGYKTGMATNLEDLRDYASDIPQRLNDLQTLRDRDLLNSAYLPELNRISSDLAAIFGDYQVISSKSAGDAPMEKRILEQKDRVEGLIRYVSVRAQK